MKRRRRLAYYSAELYSAKELSELFKISATTVRRMHRSGELPPALEIAGEARWPKEDILRYIAVMSRQRWQDQTARALASDVGVKSRPLPEKLQPLRDRLVTEYAGPCLYFLTKGETVIYVGMTLSASRRVPEHAKGNAKTPAKDFDWAPLLPVPLEELLEAERIYVALLDPPLNRNLRPALEWLPPAGEGAGH